MTPAPISVERLRELLEKATELPWRCTDGPVGYQHRVSSDGADGETVCDVERTSADAALIVAAVNALPALLQQLADAEHDRDMCNAEAIAADRRLATAESKLAERDAEVERLRIELEVSNTACGEYASQAMQASFRAQESERAREEAIAPYAAIDAEAKAAGFGGIVEAVYVGIDAAKGADAGFVVSAFRLNGEGPGNDVTVERLRQLEGRDLWAVRKSGWGDCLSVSGEWDSEPSPSNRSAEWIAAHRFASARAAIAAFLAASGGDNESR